MIGISIRGFKVLLQLGQKDGGLVMEIALASNVSVWRFIKLNIKLPKIAPTNKKTKKSIKNNLLSFCKEITEY